MGNCCPSGNIAKSPQSSLNIVVEEVEQVKFKSTMMSSQTLQHTTIAIPSTKGQVTRDDFRKVDKLGYVNDYLYSREPLGWCLRLNRYILKRFMQ